MAKFGIRLGNLIGKSSSKVEADSKYLVRLTDFRGDTHSLKVKPGENLLDIAVKNSVDIPHSCGGMGSCGTCRIRLQVHSGPAPECGELEREMATERGYTQDERLSCQIEIPAEPILWSAETLGSPDEEW